MTYKVTAYKFERYFNTEEEALQCFNEVKHNYTYCEVDRVTHENGYYYGESIEIYYK